MAKVVFSYIGMEIEIQCLKTDKMRDICNKFFTKINMNMNSLFFLYAGNKINYELSFIDQANSFDNNRNQMNILVYQNENYGLKCKKCGNILNFPFLDNIIKYNKEQKKILIEIINQLNDIINLNNINDIIRKIKNIKLMLDNSFSYNEKYLKIIKNSLSDNKDMIDTINKNNNFEIVNKFGFNIHEEKALKNIIVKSFGHYSVLKIFAKIFLKHVKIGKKIYG